MAATPPFDKTENLAHELANEFDLTWREQVHLEAALNNFYFELDRPDMAEFVNSARKFLRDVFENVENES